MYRYGGIISEVLFPASFLGLLDTHEPSTSVQRWTDIGLTFADLHCLLGGFEPMTCGSCAWQNISVHSRILDHTAISDFYCSYVMVM